MHTRYRISLVSLALLALSTTTSPAAAAQDATPTDTAQQAADAARLSAQSATAPLTLADFVGGWGYHGFSLGIQPDGSATGSWRTYDWCTTPGHGLPCDGMQGNYIIPGGRATIRFDHVEGRTYFGTVLTTTQPGVLPRGPVTITERDYGMGELMDARALGLAAVGAPSDGPAPLLCGPRLADAPQWFKDTYPCGA